MAEGSDQPRRLGHVDALRGLVMVLMALDHARDYFGFTPYQPTDLGAHDSAALFLTRWVTHFCAPVFVFLAGTSAFLWGTRHAAGDGGVRRLSVFLLTRGLWLVLLELTVVRWAWFMNMLLDWEYSFFFVQVIWALGWSMVVLGALVHLPVRVIGAAGLAMIGAHNLLDGVDPESLGWFSGMFKVLHVRGAVIWPLGGRMQVMYPLVPWIGVMATGHAFGRMMLRPRGERRRRCFVLGGCLCAAFVVLRAVNMYGDPVAWTPQGTGLFTVFSFINCEKYPPSLDFLLMTLGPAMVVLGLMDREGAAKRSDREFLGVFGRVPLFFYVLHVLVLQIAGTATAWLRYGNEIFSWKGPPPPDYYVGLWPVYLAWVGVVLALYPACRWFAGVKRRRRDWWLSYL